MKERIRQIVTDVEVTPEERAKIVSKFNKGDAITKDFDGSTYKVVQIFPVTKENSIRLAYELE